MAYAAYRTDVILRETAGIGLVGGAGLGWQLFESLSSFNWAEIMVLICVYCILTVTGEAITDRWRLNYLSNNKDQFHLFFPNNKLSNVFK